MNGIIQGVIVVFLYKGEACFHFFFYLVLTKCEHFGQGNFVPHACVQAILFLMVLFFS